MRIAISSDHAAVALRQQLAAALANWGHEIRDLGPAEGVRVDYPDPAAELARAVARGDFDRGVLICGTGIGVSIAANKIDGVRAALVHDVTTARLAAAHNDANVLCLGGRVLGPIVAQECVAAWLETDFEPRHAPRLAKIQQLEGS